jgi:isoleucyl-tRNA synthetase
VLSFFVTYSGFEKWTPASPAAETDILDEWILGKAQELVNEVTASLDNFDAFRPSRKIEEFINELSTWYVRRSRERKGPAVYQTLYAVLKTLSLVMAPFTPFLAESIWQVLKTDQDPVSVHLADWPAPKTFTDKEQNLLASMETVREAASLALNLRKEAGIPVRQPLSALFLAVKNKTSIEPALLKLLASEVNVKNADQAPTGQTKPAKSAPGTVYVESVQLDTEITPELKKEGLARSLERLVQEMRKKSGLKVGESVNLSYDTSDEELRQAMALFDRKKTYIGNILETKTEGMEEFELDGKKIGLRLQHL